MKNGLYSIHVTLQDGRVGKGSGVIMFRDGKVRCDTEVEDRAVAGEVLATMPVLGEDDDEDAPEEVKG